MILYKFNQLHGVLGFAYVIFVTLALLAACQTRKEIIASKSHAEVSKWSDAKLCYRASIGNPAIRLELLRRDLLTEQEYENLNKEDHNFFPRAGMRKCEMWAFSDDTELINISTLSDGTVREVWELFAGSYVFFKFLGGSYYLITIENDKITAVSRK